MYILLLKSASEQAADTQSDPYIQVLQRAGFKTDLIETLDFSYHVSELANLQSWREKHGAIVFTSPRAVLAVKKAEWKGQSSDLCFAVGPATELQAKKLGFAPKGSQCGDGESLANFIVNNYASQLTKPVLFPTGLVHRDSIPSILEKNGIKVNIVVAYSSQENENLKERVRINLCEGNPIPECVVFFSPSGVALTEGILKFEVKLHRPWIKIIAMGKATAAKLKDLGIDVTAVAASPRPESLLSVVQKLT